MKFEEGGGGGRGGNPSFKTKFHLDNYSQAIHVKINM